MHPAIEEYNQELNENDQKICAILAATIDAQLKNATSKIWHAHPVWFIDDNPIVGYSKQKAGLRLMFWSGASFEEENLNIVGKKFKDASVNYATVDDINLNDLKRWLKKSSAIQWDYKNIVKRKGKLERLK